jgi:hypothetical protein
MPKYVPRFRKRLTIAYKRRRRPRRHAALDATHGERLQAEALAFDHGRAEFPVATLRPREARGRAVAAIAAFERWLLARWQWFKPRTLPCAVAALGLVAIVAAADYLAHHMDQPKPEPTQKLILVDIGNH